MIKLLKIRRGIEFSSKNIEINRLVYLNCCYTKKLNPKNSSIGITIDQKPNLLKDSLQKNEYKFASDFTNNSKSSGRAFIFEPVKIENINDILAAFHKSNDNLLGFNLLKLVQTFLTVCDKIKENEDLNVNSQQITELFKEFIKRDHINTTILERFEDLYLISIDLHQISIQDFIEIMTLFIDNHRGNPQLLDKFLNIMVNKFKEDSCNTLKPCIKVLTLCSRTNYFSLQFLEYFMNHLKDNLAFFDKLPLNLLLNLSLFFALRYENTKHLHDKYYKMIELHMKRDLNYFYNSIKKKATHLKFLHNLIQSTKLYDNDYYKNELLFITEKLPFNASKPVTTLTQNQIKYVLDKLYPDRTIVVEALIGIYMVDLFIKPNIVIEVNGWGHYIDNKNRRNGLYEIKIRNLKKMGNHVIEISNYDWKIVNDDHEREFILKGLINPYISIDFYKS